MEGDLWSDGGEEQQVSPTHTHREEGDGDERERETPSIGGEAEGPAKPLISCGPPLRCTGSSTPRRTAAGGG